MDADIIKNALKKTWSNRVSSKAKGYIGSFFDMQIKDGVILARVKGNHGTYTVSLKLENNHINASCSCYKGGYCHHSEALAHTYVQNPRDFKVVKSKTLKQVKTLNDLNSYLNSTTLDKLIRELKSKGITQKDFAESIGMSTRHLSAVKSSELRNRYFHELGATKLACLWVLDHLSQP